jgi:hypothetical protein
VHAYETLKIIDCRKPNWLSIVTITADRKRNFIAILKARKDLAVLCDRLGCSPRLPERLHRWGIHALAEVLEPEGYSSLLGVYVKYPVFFVEQLHLTRNHPPVTRPFLLYCEVRGIISDHSSLEDAGCALLDYLDSFKRARLFPLAGIYQFQTGRWERVRRLTS